MTSRKAGRGSGVTDIRYLLLLLTFLVLGSAALAVVAAETALGCLPVRFAYRASLQRLYYGCQWDDTLERETHWVDLTPAEVSRMKSTGGRLLRGASVAPVELPVATPGQKTQLCDRYWLWAEDEGPRAPSMTRAKKLSQNGCK